MLGLATKHPKTLPRTCRVNFNNRLKFEFHKHEKANTDLELIQIYRILIVIVTI